MTKAVFNKKDGSYVSFEIRGHSGYASKGGDIICAAISAMSMLVINTVTDVYGEEASVYNDESKAVLSFCCKSEKAAGLLQGFFNELKALEHEYPENIIVKEK